jgi:predicted HicB family RNase H-like nuclease
MPNRTKKQITIYVTDDIKTAIDQALINSDLSLNQLINRVLKKYFKLQ